MTPQPTISPTRMSSVAGAALLGSGLVWVSVAVVRFMGGTLPRVGATAWASLLLLGVGTGWLAVRAHRRLQRDRLGVEPLRAVRWLVWGKTSLLAGVGIAAAWLAFAVSAAPGLPAPLAVERVVHAGVATVFSAGWAVAGWLLERSCRIPPDPDEDSATPPEA